MELAKRRRTRTPADSIPLGVELDRRAREVLIDARLKANLTQQELAVRLGRAQSYVSRIENGPLSIERAQFAEIARALGEDPHTLFAMVITGALEGAAKTRGRCS
jgi:transcriptional regulator with XRE-family HTH domain